MAEPEDWLRMRDAHRFDLLDGRLVEKNMSVLNSLITMALLTRLGGFADEGKSGWTFGANCGYHAFPSRPQTVRYVDGSFIRRIRTNPRMLNDGHMRIAPDLALELVHPNDLAMEMDKLVSDFIGAGTSLVWMINPGTRTARVHRIDESVQFIRESDSLSGEDVLPGFECKLNDILPPNL